MDDTADGFQGDLMTTTTARHEPSPGWTAVAVLLGVFTAGTIAATLWLAWVMSGVFGYTQPVLRPALVCAVPLALLVLATAAAAQRGRGRRAPRPLGAVAIVAVFLALVLALAGCISAGATDYDVRMHDDVPGPSGWG
jgi:hypothetical protein